MSDALVNSLNSIVAATTPLVIASIGETITERAGVINLSLNGSILLAAMAGFAAAQTSNSVIIGIGVAAMIGAVIALIIAFSAIELRRDQVAIGFVLTILTADLATFLGKPYVNMPGPRIPNMPIPLLSDIPVVGRIFFDHDLMVYFSFALVIISWYWMFHTRHGLALRAVGENPQAAFARGTKVNQQRYIYTILGGALVGVAGAAYSLSVKAGWFANPPMDGDGWIALAIVIFGGWHPFRVILGAYLFAVLRRVVADLQSTVDFPLVLLNTLPWVLMILTLMMVSSGTLERLTRLLPVRLQRQFRNVLRSDPPAAIGTRFDKN
ncbi:MAG: ABC transporter permease [Phototrophicales bacterium]